MLLAILGAFLLGLLVWGLGSMFNVSKAREAGFLVFIILVVLIVLSHGGSTGLEN